MKWKPLVWGGGIVGIILLLLFVASGASPVGKVIKEVHRCGNADEVKAVFEQHNEKFIEQNDSRDAFLSAVQEQLMSFNPSQEQIAACKQWLPAMRKNLNIIVVPDLSNRIIDQVNNPDQIRNDTTLLGYIWDAFVEKTRLKMDTRDRLIVDVADRGQAGGMFRTLANDLIFDLSEHQGKSNRLYFTDERRASFAENIGRLYDLAMEDPVGADYWSYFKYDLPPLIQQSTLSDDYRNVIILITDGYLEAQDRLHTGDLSTRRSIAWRLQHGQHMPQALGGLQIEDIGISYPSLEVLVLEVRPRISYTEQEPRDRGTDEDYQILEALWQEWFHRLEIRNAEERFFIQHSDRTIGTKNEIDKFLDR